MASESPHPTPPAPLPPAIAALLRDGVPDWDAIAFDVFCSRCEYNLRGLIQPRCPECGLEFNWVDALDWKSRAHDYLFEYNWRRKPVRSWLQTVWRSFRPRRFWTEVSLHDRVHAGPLWFVLVFSIVGFLIVLHGTAGLGWLMCEGLGRLIGLPRSYYFGISGSTNSLFVIVGECRAMLWSLATAPLSGLTAYLILLGAIAAYVAAELALLCSLRQTITRCKLRTIHMLRVLAYTATPVLTLFALLVVAEVCLSAVSLVLRIQIGLIVAGGLLNISPPLIFTYYLGIAMKRHVRLPHPWLLASLTVATATLFVVTGSVVTSVFLQGGYW
jgi:hypothetical protein